MKVVELRIAAAKVGPRYDHRIAFFRSINRLKVDPIGGEYRLQQGFDLGDLGFNISPRNDRLNFPSIGALPPGFGRKRK
jgi:hypothetical protein